jgi:tRNA(Ile)-lysidine synthase
MNGLPDIASATVLRHGMLPEGAPVVAMVSGGGDSMALLELLAGGFLGDVRVTVLHVNHMLRGEDALADEGAVVERCRALDVPCRVVRYDVAAFAQADGLNLEDAGRQVRYRFANEELDAWCDALDARRSLGRIATGHTRDDRVETFFVRALTGAGPGAFSSVPAVRGRIVRPLIDCDRSALRDWLAGRGVAWREDATNDDTARMRALVRASIVPVAEQVNPAFRTVLARSMDLMAADDALLASMADGFVHGFADSRPGVEIAFDRDMMATLDRTMARRTLRAGVLGTFPEASRIDASHVEALVDGLADDAFARDLPDGLRAFTEYARLVVCRADEQARAVAPSLLPIPGIADLGDVGRIIAEEVGPDQIEKGPDAVTIDAGLVSGEIVVDGPRPGDRIQPFGMEGTRKLQDLLTDAKVPRRERSAVPVVRDGDSIIWVAGIRSAEDYRVTPRTQRAVRLSWERRESDRDS